MAQLKYWNGSAWVDVVVGTPGSTGLQGLTGPAGLQGIQGFEGPQVTHYYYGTTAPVSPTVGDRWVDSNSGIEFTYIYDGVGYNWVETVASGFVGPTGASPQNIDGGAPNSVYGGLTTIDCGGIV